MHSQTRSRILCLVQELGQLFPWLGLCLAIQRSEGEAQPLIWHRQGSFAIAQRRNARSFLIGQAAVGGR